MAVEFEWKFLLLKDLHMIEYMAEEKNLGNSWTNKSEIFRYLMIHCEQIPLNFTMGVYYNWTV